MAIGWQTGGKRVASEWKTGGKGVRQRWASELARTKIELRPAAPTAMAVAAVAMRGRAAARSSRRLLPRPEESISVRDSGGDGSGSGDDSPGIGIAAAATASSTVRRKCGMRATVRRRVPCATCRRCCDAASGNIRLLPHFLHRSAPTNGGHRGSDRIGNGRVRSHISVGFAGDWLRRALGIDDDATERGRPTRRTRCAPPENRDREHLPRLVRSMRAQRMGTAARPSPLPCPAARSSPILFRYVRYSPDARARCLAVALAVRGGAGDAAQLPLHFFFALARLISFACNILRANSDVCLRYHAESLRPRAGA